MREWFPRTTIGSLPAQAAARWGTREALVFEGQRIGFDELSRAVDRTAAGLMALGIAPGETVALWMVNRTEWVIAAFAAFRIGAVLLPINTRLRADDVAYILKQSESTTLIVNDRAGPVDYLAMVRELLPRVGDTTSENIASPDFPDLRRVVLFGAPTAGTVSWEQLQTLGERISAEQLRTRADAVSPDDIAFLMYTSGTTGLPKGVMHDHAIVRTVVDRGNRMGIGFTDTILMYLPLFHMFGFTEGFLMSVLTGARQIVTATFDPKESLQLIESERVTLLHGFDLHFKDLVDAQASEHRDLTSIRSGILASGMSSSWPVARTARKVLGPLLSGFGMTECCVGAALSALDSTEEQCVEASGYPAPGYEIRIVDPATGLEQPTSTPGEIHIRGYAMMRGYFKKPRETADALDADGWLHTGDMGLMRPDGHLRFMGRYKDMLKIGGENVDPMEVEAFLMGHPAIDLAAVVSYPDARLAEVGVAFVRVKSGHTLTEEGAIAHCKGRIASFKIPRRVAFVESFPMTSSGKIQKAKLRDEALSRFPPGEQSAPDAKN